MISIGSSRNSHLPQVLGSCCWSLPERVSCLSHCLVFGIIVWRLMFCQRRRKDMQCNVNHKTLTPSTNNINGEIVDCRVPARSNALAGSSSCD